MKSDVSRQTFDPTKHYKSVRMQQGRVQIDADWNEQSDITINRIETEALDSIGGCGGPMHAAAFGIILDATTLDSREQARLTRLGVLPLKRDDFLLSAGRYYVDGILCESEAIASFKSQPDYPALQGESHVPAASGARPLYLVYLDVWQRNITALDDSQIREVALGGPDTGTRLKTVWQVKLAAAEATDNCITSFNKFIAANPPSSGALSARTETEAISPDPCIVPPGAGFRGLENQLYRIEIHDGGSSFNVAARGATSVVSEIISNNQVKVTGRDIWKAGQAVEIFSGDAPANLKTRTLAYVTNVDASTGTLTLNTRITNITMSDHPRIRPAKATFKWSRDNGSVVTAINRIDGRDIMVSHTGLDSVLGFAPGQWVEITDDAIELNGHAGQLAQVAEVDSARRLVTLRTAPAPLDASSRDGVNLALHPKLRRWDGIGGVDVDTSSATSGYINIEDGVQVRFSAGNYNTGDYWMIPARTATTDAQSGKIEWPQNESGSPLAQSPSGIRHHYCPLGLLLLDAEAGFSLVDDCRHLFPPVTELTSLFYVSGSGQEAMPDPAQPAELIPLPQSLVVGVANGSRAVEGATVRFHVETGNGNLMPRGRVPQGDGKTADVTTDVGGLAFCDWHIDSTLQSQQVKATLLDADDRPVHLPVIFTANLSVASEVAYDPGRCKTLQDQTTVQKALDTLSHLASLHYVNGDGQVVMPGETLQPLRVRVANRCGPVDKATVHFRVFSGTGRITPADVITDDRGEAECHWLLDDTTTRQEAVATLVEDREHPAAPPTQVFFSATLSTANHVSYDPSVCPDLSAASVKTVQQAIDTLCQRSGGGGRCEITVGEGGQFPDLEQAIRSLVEVPQDLRNVDVCICLMPGDHRSKGLRIDGTGNKVRVKIAGCGRGSRIILLQDPVEAIGLVSFTLKDVEVFTDQPGGLFTFDRCDEITLEGCHMTQENQGKPFITIAHARRIQIEGNIIGTFLVPERGVVLPAEVFASVERAVSELFAIVDDAEFDRKSREVASSLADFSATRKRNFIRLLQQSLIRLENLTPDEDRGYKNFIAAFNAQPADALLIGARLTEIRVATSRGAPGIAIVIMDAEADTWINDNNITGVVSLYGPPGKIRITEEEIRLLSAALQRGAVVFSDSLANLQVRDNILYRMDISEQLTTLLKTIARSNANSNSIDRLYRRCFIADNAISGSGNDFVMEHLALTSNSFDIIEREDAGTVVANAAINVGNYAPKDIRLFVLARAKERAANLGINIVEI